MTNLVKCLRCDELKDAASYIQKYRPTKPYKACKECRVRIKAGLKLEHRCTTCQETFVSRTTLKRHITVVHEGIRNSICGECNSAFSDPYILKVHVDAVHLNIRNETCDECKTTFARAGDLKFHIDTVHNGVRNYPCELCTLKFGSMTNLKAHMNGSTHMDFRGFPCGECNYAAHTKAGVEIHIKAAHRKIRDLLCSRCDFKTSMSTNLTAHIAICTGREHISSGEYIVRNVLESLSVSYAREMRFHDCKDKRSLPFDFYLPDHRIAIEFDGEQHFEPNVRFGGLEAFQLRQAHDAIKNTYCIEKNIYLLRIKHTDKRRTRELITDFLAQTEPSRIILEYLG